MHEKYDKRFISLVWSVQTKQMSLTFQRNHCSSFSQFERYFEHTAKPLDAEMCQWNRLDSVLLQFSKYVVVIDPQVQQLKPQ